MKKSILLFTLFLTNPFLLLCSDAQSANLVPQVIETKLINKKLELFKAVKNGISGIVACTASYYAAIVAKNRFEYREKSRIAPFFIGLDIFIALALLDLGCSKLAIALESLKQLTVKSSATSLNPNISTLPINPT